ncbi:hydrolase, carbon-nitrogen family protein, partial [Toxoplasma gondii TgCatPRC2]
CGEAAACISRLTKKFRSEIHLALTLRYSLKDGYPADVLQKVLPVSPVSVSFSSHLSTLKKSKGMRKPTLLPRPDRESDGRRQPFPLPVKTPQKSRTLAQALACERRRMWADSPYGETRRKTCLKSSLNTRADASQTPSVM